MTIVLNINYKVGF